MTAGLLVVAIGVIHQLVGLLTGLGWMPGPGGATSAPLVDLVRAGFVGQAEGDPLRMALVWFLLFGFMMILTGVALHRLERSGVPLGRDAAAGFGSLCLLGVVLMPASGFWLGFIPTVLLWRRARGESTVRA
ncbi:MAG: DUF6463 family protein [Archangium sp.]|nr:DUF6463 family protein [Archangium sp.]